MALKSTAQCLMLQSQDRENGRHHLNAGVWKVLIAHATSSTGGQQAVGCICLVVLLFMAAAVHSEQFPCLRVKVSSMHSQAPWPIPCLSSIACIFLNCRSGAAFVQRLAVCTSACNEAGSWEGKAHSWQTVVGSGCSPKQGHTPGSSSNTLQFERHWHKATWRQAFAFATV